ncbi:MAG: T9SS C-terminal target domain-containing protein, partial [Bacteroidetes bacterium]
PNPSGDELYLYIQNVDAQKLNIQIYDITGREIHSITKPVLSNTETFNLSNEINLPKGFYFITIYNEKQESIFFEQIIRK